MHSAKKRSSSIYRLLCGVKNPLKVLTRTLDLEVELLQVALVRGDADASCAAPRLTLEEKAGIADKHAKKQVDAQKRGVSVMLRDIMAHKVHCYTPPQSLQKISIHSHRLGHFQKCLDHATPVLAS